jgi:C4-dicarboxylate transporter DctM subunit
VSSPVVVGGIGFGVMLILVAMGTPIAFATALVGLGGMLYLVGPSEAGGLLGGLPWSIAANYTLIVIPAFIMKGYFAAYGGISTALYNTVRKWFGHYPGGLAIATMWGAALWCTMAGSSVATVTVFGKMALPEMLQSGYSRRLATGCIAVAGGMAAILPPGSTLILYAIFTQNSVGQLLAAGLLPGLMEAATLSIFIYLRARRRPELGPPLPAVPWKERIDSIWSGGNGLFIVIVGLVFGGIFSGLMTVTEAGSVGCVLTFILVLTLGQLNGRNMHECMMAAAKITVTLFAILIGTYILLSFLAFSGFTTTVTSFFVGLHMPTDLLVLVFLVMYLFLGSFMESTGMMALTLPLFYPILSSLGVNGIWFGILVVKMIEIGLIHPPLGINVYILKAAAPDTPVHEIFLGAAPFMLVQFLNVGLIFAFPQIVLLLPHLFFKGVPL